MDFSSTSLSELWKFAFGSSKKESPSTPSPPMSPPTSPSIADTYSPKNDYSKYFALREKQNEELERRLKAADDNHEEMLKMLGRRTLRLKKPVDKVTRSDDDYKMLQESLASIQDKLKGVDGNGLEKEKEQITEIVGKLLHALEQKPTA